MDQNGPEQPSSAKARDDAELRFQRNDGAPPLRVEIDGAVPAQPIELRILRNGLLRCAGGPDAEKLDLTGWKLAMQAANEADGDPTLRQRPAPFRPYLLLDGSSDAIPLPIEEGAALVVGRGHQAAIRLSDPRVSRVHARILIRGGQPHVEDLGSMLGTRLNGKLLRGVKALRRHDVLEIGSDRLVFHSLAHELREANEQIAVALPPPAARASDPGGDQARTPWPWDTVLAVAVVITAVLCIGWLTCIVVSA